MLQWQMVQHKIGDELKYSLSLVDVSPDMTVKFILSIARELTEDGNFIAMRGSDKMITQFPAKDFFEALLSISKEYECIIGYEKND